MANAWPKQRRLLGTKIQRLDGPDKSTGTAKYSFDINRPGLLHGVILRSPYAHAKIKRLDTSAAEKMPGVKAVYVIGSTFDVTVARVDAEKNTIISKIRQGNKDVEQPVPIVAGMKFYRANKEITLADVKPNDVLLIESKARAAGRELYFAGDEIVALAADTEEHAADALRAIQVEYDILPHVVKEEDGLKEPTKGTLPGAGAGNVRVARDAAEGDVESAFKSADAVHEGTYGAAAISHQCLESHGLVAEWDGDGSLTVWASTQATVGTAQELSREFKIPVTKVKCITHYMGAGYGSKFGADIQGRVAAHLAKKSGAPVKLLLDRAEEIAAGGLRPSAFGTVKIAGTKDGMITAYQIDCYGTSGQSNSPTVGPLPYVYQFPNNKVKHTVVRLNAQNQRAMRAPGHPQSCMLTECAVEELAAKLGLDPLQVRLKNCDPAVVKKQQAPVALRRGIYLKELEIAADLSKWKDRWHPPGKGPGNGPVKHGIGMALHTWGGQGFPGNEVTATISSDGSVLMQCSTQDLGTGERTVLAIVAAETLGLDVKDITVRIGESPFGSSTGSGGSTTSPATSPAALNAVSAARDDLFKKIANRLGAKPEDLAIEVGKVVDKANGKSWVWKEACAKLGMDTATAKGAWTAGLSDQGVGGVQVAEVLVDTETGVVRCTKMVAVQDCGLVINKLCCESQVAGGVIMGLNYALFEEIIFDRRTGRQVNADMEFYKLGGMEDMPQIVVHMHDMPERGVIGIGEPPTIGTAAAISNAIYNALGVRVPYAPFTPDRVLAALAKA
jgi:xanthine dehydrogenase YagR molybdenum-binding subunit